MAIEVFNRYENKYLIDKSIFDSIQVPLKEFMKLDSHCLNDETYQLCNIYYDTNDSHLIRTSLEHPPYKEKLRLRSYGVPKLDCEVYIEIKKKYDKLVNKRRLGVDLSGAYEFLESGIAPRGTSNQQVAKEVENFLKLNELTPKMYIAYRRLAYLGEDDHDIRLTFDFDITSRAYDLDLEKGVYGDKLLGEDQVLMEIKTSQSIPLCLANLLSEQNIYRTSFSKYGRAYLTNIEKEVCV
ncbi:MAG: polyphosphate polymerase domain-containing protein [Clostridioides sp.]|nr:polyphosphate polymerase domain-containing protein [Clostridioides sp.]